MFNTRPLTHICFFKLLSSINIVQMRKSNPRRIHSTPFSIGNLSQASYIDPAKLLVDKVMCIPCAKMVLHLVSI